MTLTVADIPLKSVHTRRGPSTAFGSVEISIALEIMTGDFLLLFTEKSNRLQVPDLICPTFGASSVLLENEVIHVQRKHALHIR